MAYRNGWGIAAPLLLAVVGLMSACGGGKTQGRQDCGDYDTCVSLGATARDRGDQVAAASFYQRACELRLDGCVELGSFYEFWVLDPVSAEAAYKRGCDGGSATSCYNLGMFYEYNEWGANYGRAGEAYQRACQLDYNYCSY